MIKKIAALLTAIAMTASSVMAASYSDADFEGEKGEAIESLSALGVLSGMGDGTFKPEGFLTRAQFAKIASVILGKADEAVTYKDAFSDVSSSDWFSGYVSIVSREGIIEGYPDGSFGAYDEITYAQAITVLVRLLGYSAEDVGYRWPKGYIDKAGVLGITKGIDFEPNQLITRAEAAVIISRALFTDMKSGGELVTKMDARVYENAVILATRKENSALLENEVQTSVGTFKINNVRASVGYEGTLTVNEDNEVIGFVKNPDMREEEYIASRIYRETNSDSVFVMTDKGETIALDSETAIYKNGAKMKAAEAEGVTEGSKITLYYEKNLLKHGILDEYTLEGPKTVTKKGSVEDMFNISDSASLTVIRKGIKSQISDIEMYDVCYYSERTNTLYAYNDRATGVYEEAYPIKANVSEVKISGKKYKLSTAQAVSKLNESEAAFRIGERVTLLLGTDGSAVDAVSLTKSDLSSYGVVTGTGIEKSEEPGSEGRAERYVTILLADGTAASYRTDTDIYEDKAGKFCEVDFENSYARLTFPKEKSVSGRVSMADKSIGGVRLAADFAILEMEDSSSGVARVSKISLSDIDNVILTSSKVIHAQYNEKGEIAVLYLDNASGRRNIYGVVIETPGDKEAKGSYVILSGTDKYVITGKYPSLAVGQAIGYYAGIEKTDTELLMKAGSGVKVTKRIDNIITLDGKSFTISDDVKVFVGKYSYDFKAAAIDDIIGQAGAVTLYSDASAREGGKVQVITLITA